MRRAREVSNTPLQALTLLNDPVFQEAAQALGRLMAASARIGRGTRDRALFRPLPHAAARIRRAGAARQFLPNAESGGSSCKELDAARSPAPAKATPASARPGRSWRGVILNLDETITKG